jgi:hypothetical protein
MPDERDGTETAAHAEREARLAHAYFDTLIGMGADVRVATELACAWIIARERAKADVAIENQRAERERGF